MVQNNINNSNRKGKGKTISTNSVSSKTIVPNQATPATRKQSRSSTSTTIAVDKKKTSIKVLTENLPNSRKNDNDREMIDSPSSSSSAVIVNAGNGAPVLLQETELNTATTPTSPTSPEGGILGMIISTTDDELNKSAQQQSQPIRSVEQRSSEPLPDGWEEHEDNAGPYYWHISTGVIRRERPTSSSLPMSNSRVFYHEDEEINQVSGGDDEDDDDDIYDERAFLVSPMGCCDYDETQITSSTSSKAIQRCLSNLSSTNEQTDETRCWGLSRDRQIVMRFTHKCIDFIDASTDELVNRQPIGAIKVWAVNDDTAFAFVVEENRSYSNDQLDVKFSKDNTDDETGPVTRCYVMRSVEDNDMCNKVATIMNDEMKKIKDGLKRSPINVEPLIVEDDIEEHPYDKTFIVKYLGRTTVPAPTGIEVLNNGIDECVVYSEAHTPGPVFATMGQLNETHDHSNDEHDSDSLIKKTNIECKIHVSPSSIIVESCTDGDVLVECRIRYLTFMGISKRNVKWYGFIMQLDDNEFQAHCFECNPSAGPVCQAIQRACTSMYQRVIQNDPGSKIIQPQPQRQRSLLPSLSLKSALRKTLARITTGR